MNLKNNSGLTLVENLVAILLVSTLLIGVMGAFFISRSSISRARHRMTAMSIVREWMEKELAVRGGGYGSGGYEAFNPDTDSTRVVDNVTYTIVRYPEVSPTLYEPAGDLTGIPYTTLGFKVSWQENFYLTSGSVTCSEKAVTHVARH